MTFLFLSLLTLHPKLASAQVDVSALHVSYRFRRADLRSAITSMCEAVRVNCTIDPLIHGKVTMAVRDVSFEEGLQKLLGRYGATYRAGGGVLEIVAREDAPPPLEARRTGPYQRKRGVGRWDVRSLLASLFKASKLHYSLSPDVQGVVGSDRYDNNFDANLQQILKQVGATYRVDGGLYRIEPLEDSFEDSDIYVGRLANRKLFLNADNSNGLNLLFRLLDVGKKSFAIGPYVGGRDTLQLQGVSFDEALKVVLETVRGHMKVSSGILVVLPPRGWTP